MHNQNPLSSAHEDRKFYISWHEFHRDARALAWNLPKKSWKGIVAIARGGLIPATIVARELDILLIETVCLSSYDDKTDQQKKLSIIKNLPPQSGKDWLVIDDLIDTGTTIQAVRAVLPDAHYASVYAKSHGKAYIDTFVTEINAWIVFPWEMDLETLRNLGRF